MMLLAIKLLAITGALSFASVELGAEFFTAVNTTLNLLTVIYVTRTHRDVRDTAPVINQVAHELDTRMPGGQRDSDPESPLS